MVNAPQKEIILDNFKHNRTSNFNLELSVSPIMNPSILELQDASTEGVSLYDSKPSNINMYPFQEHTFASTNQSLDIENTANTSLLTESIFTAPCKKKFKSNLSQLNYTLTDGHSEMPIKKNIACNFKRLAVHPKTVLDTEKPLSINKSKLTWEKMDWYRQNEKNTTCKEDKKAKDNLKKETSVGSIIVSKISCIETFQ